jgi:hypothetical protein
MSRKNRQQNPKTKLSVPRIFMNVLVTVLQIAVFNKIAMIGCDWLRRVQCFRLENDVNIIPMM